MNDCSDTLVPLPRFGPGLQACAGGRLAGVWRLVIDVCPHIGGRLPFFQHFQHLQEQLDRSAFSS